MADLSSRRWVVFDGPRIVNPVPSTASAFVTAGGSLRGSDTLGHVIAMRSTATSQILNGPSQDSALLVRVRVATGTADTLAKLASRPAEISSTPGTSGAPPASFSIRFTILGAGEEAILFPDGWVAVVRLHPYRMDWRRPNGIWTRGAPLPFAEIRVDDREKKAYRERQVALLGRDVVPADATWAATIPPFQINALVALHDGRVLVQRTPSADHSGNRYDVIDRSGTLQGHLALPPNERIMAAGENGIYVIVTGTDGLQQLRRHPPP
jgi:hypothetical protein